MRIFLLILVCIVSTSSTIAQEVKHLKAENALETVEQRDTATTVLIDGRDAAFFKLQKIKGAVNIDAFQDSCKTTLNNYLHYSKIIVYCTNFKRAKLIIEYLKALNYSGQIIFISDGINGWISEGHPTVKMKKIHSGCPN